MLSSLDCIQNNDVIPKLWRMTYALSTLSTKFYYQGITTPSEVIEGRGGGSPHLVLRSPDKSVVVRITLIECIDRNVCCTYSIH